MFLFLPRFLSAIIRPSVLVYYVPHLLIGNVFITIFVPSSKRQHIDSLFGGMSEQYCISAVPLYIFGLQVLYWGVKSAPFARLDPSEFDCVRWRMRFGLFDSTVKYCQGVRERRYGWAMTIQMRYSMVTNFYPRIKWNKNTFLTPRAVRSKIVSLHRTRAIALWIHDND